MSAITLTSPNNSYAIKEFYNQFIEDPKKCSLKDYTETLEKIQDVFQAYHKAICTTKSDLVFKNECLKIYEVLIQKFLDTPYMFIPQKK